MNCLCNLFNDDCLWIIILIILVLMLACGNCSCGGSSRNRGPVNVSRIALVRANKNWQNI